MYYQLLSTTNKTVFQEITVWYHISQYMFSISVYSALYMCVKCVEISTPQTPIVIGVPVSLNMAY